MDRRLFLGASIAGAAALGVAGVPGLAAVARAQGAPDETGTEIDALAEHLVRDPMSLQLLDIVGTLNFADAMGGIAVQGDSLVQKLLRKVGPAKPAHEHDDDHHDHKFPLANLTLAASLNIVRASAFGAEVRHHTIHEFEVTIIGVAMLMGLTSVAKGIISSEETAMQMMDRDDVAIRRDPEETIVDSIFQLTIVSAATQIPLSSFGNAAIGNEQFREVRLAFTELYRRFLPEPIEGVAPSREAIVTHLRSKLAECKNPVIARQVTKVLEDETLTSADDYAAALKAAATWHTHDLMTILMSTSCDDSQAALGDPGPLVGLYQTYGIDFLHALPSLVPYTIAVGFERALWAMNRAGVQRPIFTRAKWVYLKNFLKETWKNLIVYFATVAPEISSKITGTRRVTGSKTVTEEGVGVSFSVLEQVLQDIESIITAAMDPFLNDRVLDTRKTRKAVAELQDATRQWHEAMGRRVAGRLFPPREGSEHEGSVARTESLEDQANIIGQKESGGAPYEYKKDELPKNLKDVQIRLASIIDEAGIDKLATELQDIRRTVGPQIQKEIEEEIARQGSKPTVMTALEVMRKNPRLRDLVDINYWHGRVGPAITDTMFVVLLQGIHLPFLLNTSERVMYNASWFKGMPLVAREVVSVLYNNAIGLFADNWADCVAHAKWLTNMYLSELAVQLGELGSDFPEVEAASRSAYFKDDSTALIPERFKTNAAQAAGLISVLQARYPAETERLDAALRRYLETAEVYYFKSMVMAMTISVVGAGKSLPGDSTHFTFAAGEKDFTLAVTLLDFKRHPLYHVWELLFSGAYAMFAGPFLAQTYMAPLLGKLGVGSGAVATLQGLMQTEFRRHYPGMAERFEQLEAQLPKRVDA